MPKERYFIEKELTLGQELVVSGDEFHHLCHVMRTQVGEIVEIINGAGVLAKGEVKKVSKKEAYLCVIERIFKEKPPFEVVLVQACPRFNRLEFILEKGTELGMSQLLLVASKLSEKKGFTENQWKRIHTITTAAMKQCGTLWLPSIQDLSLNDWPTPFYPAFFGDTSPTAPLFSHAWNLTPSDKGVFMFIGPEGGFTPEEVERLRAMNVRGVKLHEHILRTDTAALASLSVVQQLKYR